MLCALRASVVKNELIFCKSSFLALGAVLALLLAGCNASPLPQGKSTPDSGLFIATMTLPPAGTPQADATPLSEAATPEPDLATLLHYTVQPGDTLLGIAVRHNVSMAAIQLVNDMRDSTVVQVDQELVIPPPLREDETPFWIVHVVQPGESLSKIARVYGVTVEAILQVNAIADPELIKAGQLLVIPVQTLALAPPATQPPLPSDTPVPRPTAAPTARATQAAGAADTPSATTSTSEAMSSATPTFTPQPPPTIPPKVSAWAGQAVDLINQKRLANGLPALAIAPELMQAAQLHAEDCSARGWGSHVGSDGANTLTRIQRAGYAATAWGENWVQAFDPARAVNWWYDETPPNDPHRKNILSARYSEVGVGIAPADAGRGFYFIADFGSR